MTSRYIFFSVVAVFLTFFLHELFHWITGEILGYKMIMTLNSVTPASGQYREDWHNTLVSAAGPLFTIIQAAILYFIMRKNKNVLLYPFLFIPLYMRILAGVMNVINLNDEGRISRTFGLGTFTLSILVCLFLFFLVYKISRQYKYTAKFQVINVLLTMAFSSVLILSDQVLHLKIIR